MSSGLIFLESLCWKCITFSFQMSTISLTKLRSCYCRRGLLLVKGSRLLIDNLLVYLIKMMCLVSHVMGRNHAMRNSHVRGRLLLRSSIIGVTSLTITGCYHSSLRKCRSHIILTRGHSHSMWRRRLIVVISRVHWGIAVRMMMIHRHPCYQMHRITISPVYGWWLSYPRCLRTTTTS